MSDYEHADYYDARGDVESLQHETPEDAIESMLDSWAEPNCDMVALIKEHSPVEVKAYARYAVPVQQAECWAESITEQLHEWWTDEYGDPEGDDDFPTSPFTAQLTALIQAALTDAKVWRCDPCGKRTYSTEEVETMMREQCPYWFQPAGGASKGQ